MFRQLIRLYAQNAIIQPTTCQTRQSVNRIRASTCLGQSFMVYAPFVCRHGTRCIKNWPSNKFTANWFYFWDGVVSYFCILRKEFLGYNSSPRSCNVPLLCEEFIFCNIFPEFIRYFLRRGKGYEWKWIDALLFFSNACLRASNEWLRIVEPNQIQTVNDKARICGFKRSR